MCGRYTHLFAWSELHKLLGALVPGVELTKRYNIAPSQKAPIIRRQEDGELIGALFRWGLIPSWAKDPKIGYSLINARSETVDSKPSFRAAFKTRRCVVPISGFFEWQKVSSSKLKQPYYITPKNNLPLFIAGLFEHWAPEEGEPLDSYTLITTTANKILEPFHDRMPVILTAETCKAWMDPKTNPDELKKLFSPYPEDELNLSAVSTLVNSPKNDSPMCIEKSEIIPSVN